MRAQGITLFLLRPLILIAYRFRIYGHEALALHRNLDTRERQVASLDPARPEAAAESLFMSGRSGDDFAFLSRLKENPGAATSYHSESSSPSVLRLTDLRIDWLTDRRIKRMFQQSSKRAKRCLGFTERWGEPMSTMNAGSIGLTSSLAPPSLKRTVQPIPPGRNLPRFELHHNSDETLLHSDHHQNSHRPPSIGTFRCKGAM